MFGNNQRSIFIKRGRDFPTARHHSINSLTPREPKSPHLHHWSLSKEHTTQAGGARIVLKGSEGMGDSTARKPGGRSRARRIHGTSSGGGGPTWMHPGCAVGWMPTSKNVVGGLTTINGCDTQLLITGCPAAPLRVVGLTHSGRSSQLGTRSVAESFSVDFFSKALSFNTHTTPNSLSAVENLGSWDHGSSRLA